MKKIIYIVLLLGIGLLIFWLGKRSGTRIVSQEVISNSLIVKEIAELASLDVQGNASIKRSNIENSGNWTDNLKKTFLENTVWITIPYQAKYGVNIDDQHFKVSVNDKKIVIELPAPRLLSYELKIDKMETSNRKGWFLFQDDETYTDVQKSLYRTSRQQLENNPTYIQQSKDRIRKVMEQYYAPFLKDHTLEIRYVGESKAPVLD
ncbi:Protein of unknown function [Chitinophaga terrae (ex Kim and Jung 2007)]|uniref:DUF4230 domain-containing protein n=1 Tax=Chitinophaga terrae (ex Kim and Jung 2007) TaxID=408074 RepID=A0A1H4BIM0_9BACT|nr:DUF4230 domain-containing protein [Chitinophaga terrae (ex Kim and Jung 2007)]MDQ0109336.1 hypothetical protein [Chitinophaga terrae (ex Kim and Jung 2007)]GEP89576.1 hypothetical protein CTE07_12210 [Chitinophaga terrae (ex Kim and Jung 2007)]SEA47894.1 Protein of unknown function [Chitinophaga terrae (ex Kim and Jung 2007)]